MTNGTKTSDFGASKRENHDSSHFYASKLYTEIPAVSSKPSDGLENPFPKALVNNIIEGDSRDLSMIPDLSNAIANTQIPNNFYGLSALMLLQLLWHTALVCDELSLILRPRVFPPD